jgi:hypothetical protein
MRLILAFAIAISCASGRSIFEISQDHNQNRVSSSEIEEAITFGLSSDVAPYALKSIFPRAKEPAAVVYTPFVRIASKARRAFAAGRPYAPHDVDAEAAAALVHVVMSADALIPVKGLTPSDPIAMAVVKAADQRLLHTGEADMARLVFEQPERVEPKLRRSGSHGVVVGAFEPTQLCAGCYVVGFRMRIEPDGHREILSVWARVTADDVRSWR